MLDECSFANNNCHDPQQPTPEEANESVEESNNKRRKTFEISDEENGEACPHVNLKDKIGCVEVAKSNDNDNKIFEEETYQKSHRDMCEFNGRTSELNMHDTQLLYLNTEEQMTEPDEAIIKDAIDPLVDKTICSLKNLHEIESKDHASDHQEPNECVEVNLEDKNEFVEVVKANDYEEITHQKNHHDMCKSNASASELDTQLLFLNTEEQTMKPGGAIVNDEIDPFADKTMCSLKDDHETESKDHAPDQKEPVSCNTSASDYNNMLANSNVLTGNGNRDKWLEKLLEGLDFVCNNKSSNLLQDSLVVWPDDAVSAVIELERASHESLCSQQKYNQKMRQLCFNLKKNAKLAWRVLKRDLKPSQILSMQPNELKEGLTAEEMSSDELEEDVVLPMTDARCERCTEKKVCLVEIISTGRSDRYQLECAVCGKRWYTSREEDSTFAILSPRAKPLS